MNTKWIIGYLTLSLMFVVSTVSAQEPAAAPDAQESAAVEPAARAQKPISLGLLLGYALDFEEGDVNPFGFGFGLRGGYTLNMGLYLGGHFVYFLGESYDMAGGEASINVITIAAEVGYDLNLQPIVIRPSLLLGLGLSSVSVKMEAMGVSMDESETETDLFLGPGASVIYPLDGFFIGADLRFLLVMAEESITGMSIMVNGGMNL